MASTTSLTRSLSATVPSRASIRPLQLCALLEMRQAAPAESQSHIAHIPPSQHIALVTCVSLHCVTHLAA